MSTLKTHNLQSPDAGSVNIAMSPNAGMIVSGISTFTGAIDANGDLDVDGHTNLDNVSIAGVTTSSNKFQVNGLGIGIQPIDHHHIHIESANPRILIRSTGTNAAKILFGDNNSNDSGVIEYAHSSNSMIFSTGNNERARILSGGEFAIGGSGYGGQPFSLQTSSTNLGYMETTSTTRGVMSFRDGNSTQNVGFGCIGNNHVFMKDGNEKVRITSDGDVAITTRGSVEGVSKLNVEIPARTTAFNAADGDTWHDVLIENPGAATNNAVGLAFEVTGDLYHKNAGTGIAAVKNGTNSDYGADLVFITRGQSVVASEKMRIDSNGYVTKSNQPSFHARRVSNASSTTNPLVFDAVHHNNGSHYKSSGTDQGKFVAPVAGVYLFYWCAIKTNNGSVCRLYIKKNGSNIYGSMHLRLQEQGTYSNGSIQAILNLAAGDKIHISLEAGSIHGSEYTHFGGYLIH